MKCLYTMRCPNVLILKDFSIVSYSTADKLFSACNYEEKGRSFDISMPRSKAHSERTTPDTLTSRRSC